MGKVKRMLYEEQEHDELMRDQEPDFDDYAVTDRELPTKENLQREIVEYKEFLASCIKAPIEEVIRDYYECNKELRTDLESMMIERNALLKEKELVYEAIVGDEGINRFTHDEMIDYIKVLNEQIVEWELETNESFIPKPDWEDDAYVIEFTGENIEKEFGHLYKKEEEV